MPITSEDHSYMAHALRIAERGNITTRPNPRVGCVIVKNGNVIAEAWHERAGEGHAEIRALEIAGSNAEDACVYVTLEPCNHTGRTGPCSHALAKSKVQRVVYAMQDPNPLVSGSGLDYLRSKTIIVDGPLLEEVARKLNVGFVKRMEKKMPRVLCKMAMSLDGRTAMASGESQWVTGPKARNDVQRLRAESCAIISGIGSILQDDSSLLVRKAELANSELTTRQLELLQQPLRVILDSSLRINKTAKLFQQDSPVLLVHACDSDTAVQKKAELPSFVELIALPAADGRIDLEKLLKELALRQCNQVMVEAGATLASSFLKRGLLDELIIYMAPKLMGASAKPLFDLSLSTMSASLPLKIIDMRAVGSDWRITAVPDIEY